MSEDTDSTFNNKAISKNKQQELNDLYMLIKKERLKYMKNDILIETIIESCSPIYGLHEALAVKVKDIILRGELINSIQVKKEPASIQQFLLDDFNRIELNFENQKDLKIALERKIKEKGELYLKDLNDLSDNDVKSLEELVSRIKFDSKSEQDNLLSLQSQLLEQQQMYIESLSNLGTKIQELIDLKTKSGVEISKQKAVENMAETEKYKLRYKIISVQVRIAIFEELPISIDAYRKALSDLKTQQDECKREIDEMRNDLESYKLMIKNEEYKDILDEYKQYKRRVDKKLWISNELNKNKK